MRPRLELLEGRETPAVLLVTTLADSVASDGLVSLREAIQAANTDTATESGATGNGADTIAFDPSLFGTTAQELEITQGALQIRSALTIEGPGAKLLTLNGNDSSQIFNVDDGTSAVLAVTISDLTLSGGSASMGGAISNREDLTLLRSVLSGNTALRGGGLYNRGTTTIVASTISNNAANDGAGVQNLFGIVSLFNTTVSGNLATGYGGGIDSLGGAAQVTITNSTITQNVATLGGGGVSNRFGSLALYNAILAGNLSAASPDLRNAGAVTASHSLLGDDTGSGLEAANPGDNLIGSSAAPLDPMLGPLQDNGGPTPTHLLLDDSPAVDAGNDLLAAGPSGAALATDQRGFARISGDAVDIGAAEGVAAAVNAAPSSLDLSSTQVAENLPAGAAVGVFSGTDPDGDELTFQLIAGLGDNALFQINADGVTLEAKATFDFEAMSQFTIVARVSDDGGLSFERTFTISIADVNESPTGAALSNTVLDGDQPAGSVVGLLSALDPDVGDPLKFSLVAGAADNHLFQIGADGVTLATAADLPVGSRSSYTVVVRVMDAGGLSIDRVFNITVEPSANVLLISGTEQDDRIFLRVKKKDPDILVVRSITKGQKPVVTEFELASVDMIELIALGGNDLVNIDHDLGLPITVDPGSESDLVITAGKSKKGR